MARSWKERDPETAGTQNQCATTTAVDDRRPPLENQGPRISQREMSGAGHRFHGSGTGARAYHKAHGRAARHKPKMARLQIQPYRTRRDTSITYEVSRQACRIAKARLLGVVECVAGEWRRSRRSQKRTGSLKPIRNIRSSIKSDLPAAEPDRIRRAIQKASGSDATAARFRQREDGSGI